MEEGGGVTGVLEIGVIIRARARAFPLSEYDQLADYLLFNAYSAATHTTLAAVIRDNKSAPCKRKFRARGTFVHDSRARSYCAEIYFTSRAGPLLFHSSHILATGDPLREPRCRAGSLFPLSIFVGDIPAKNLPNRNELFADDRR